MLRENCSSSRDGSSGAAMVLPFLSSLPQPGSPLPSHFIQTTSVEPVKRVSDPNCCGGQPGCRVWWMLGELPSSPFRTKAPTYSLSGHGYWAHSWGPLWGLFSLHGIASPKVTSPCWRHKASVPLS